MAERKGSGILTELRVEFASPGMQTVGFEKQTAEAERRGERFSGVDRVVAKDVNS